MAPNTNGDVAPPPQNSADLLKHYEEYGVIICKPCSFAIQPSALASHLLKHQIYRSERRKLISQLVHLKLTDPADVVDPAPMSNPVPELQIYKGLRCLHKGCQHICASEKRMSQHWSEVHGERESKNVITRPAWLQTFFRGNKIRYFEVSGPFNGPVSITSSPASNDSPATPRTNIDSTSSPVEPPLTLDMDSLRYLLYYKEHTALSLPRNDRESTWFWTAGIPQEALKHPFLMSGLLGLAAFHMARVTPDPAQSAYHHAASVRYQAASLTDFRELTRRPDVSNAVALIAYSRLIAIQRCTRDIDDAYKVNWITEFMYLIRGSVEQLISLQAFLPHDCEFKLSLQQLEGIARLDDEAARSKDAENVAKIPSLMLDRLDQLPQRLGQVLGKPDPANMKDVQASFEACTALIAAYARAYSAKAPPVSAHPPLEPRGDMVAAIWNGFESWTRTVSDHYIHLLEINDGPALIILAHFCVLVKRFEERYWYVQGMPGRMIELIENKLDDHLKPFVNDLYDILD